MMPSGPHHLQRAAMRFPDHRTATPSYPTLRLKILSINITDRIGDTTHRRREATLSSTGVNSNLAVLSQGLVSLHPPGASHPGKLRRRKESNPIQEYGSRTETVRRDAKPDVVMLRIPKGDRPQLDDIKGNAAGLTELKRLMKRCWDHKPEQRPRALECTTETEKLFKMHKHAINNAVYEVLMKLDQKKEDGMAAGAQVQRDQIAEASVEGTQQLLRELNLLAVPQQRVDPLRVQRRDLMKYSCELTLDTNTVNRELKLSNNNRTVTRVEEYQPYPDHPERFDWPQLLCRDGLTGRCYWEVERRGGRVSIAVSYRGISRRGNSVDYWFGRNDQSWRLWCSDDGYSVWHNNNRTSLPCSSSSVSRRVGVYVDCPAGSLSFYTVSSGSLIHLYTFNTTFTLPLYPGFAFGSYGASISLG